MTDIKLQKPYVLHYKKGSMSTVGVAPYHNRQNSNSQMVVLPSGYSIHQPVCEFGSPNHPGSQYVREKYQLDILQKGYDIYLEHK